MGKGSPLVGIARELGKAVDELRFAPPVSHVYNPLDYAWPAHAQYLERYGAGCREVLLLGMNPGPWGMAQTGVPFGDVEMVDHWLHIKSTVSQPRETHPKRPVQGFSCARSEVSGKRLWGLMADRFQTAELFFQDHFVANYCPLLFIEESGRNRTPDKLPGTERDKLVEICDRYLKDCMALLQPEWVVGIGNFARDSARRALDGLPIKTGHILHPSPASPDANRGWAQTAIRQLADQNIW